NCDNILIASPNYFSELSGQLLAVASRLQSFWSARHFRKEELIHKKKRGGIVLVGGGDGHMSTPITTATCLLNHMSARNIAAPVCFHDTNNNPAIEDADTIAHLKELAAFFNDNANIND
ncbi:MAG: flavodoxin family protein, partial [Clostridiaceae bacterium]